MTAPLTLDTLPGLGPLYAPPGDAAVPTVMILHGSEGPGSGWSHRFAAILAAHGFGALPYAYGQGDVWGAGAIRDVDISAIPTAGRTLAAHPRVAGLGLLGWSRGGELAVLLGAIGAGDLPFQAIAAHAPSDHVNAAFDPSAPREAPPEPSHEADRPRAWRWPGHNDQLAPGTQIKIERYPGPVFLSVGTQDDVWDHSKTLHLADRLQAAGRDADLFLAEGQGHALDFAVEPQLWARLSAFFARHLAVAEA